MPGTTGGSGAAGGGLGTGGGLGAPRLGGAWTLGAIGTAVGQQHLRQILVTTGGKVRVTKAPAVTAPASAPARS